LSQFPSVWDALDTTIHVASISKIGKSHQTFHRVLIQLCIILFLQLTISLSSTLVNVESLVFFQAIIIAVLYIFALANRSHYISLTAPLTDTNCQFLILVEHKRESLLQILSEFNHYLLVFSQCELIYSQTWVQEWLQRLSGEINPTVHFDALFISHTLVLVDFTCKSLFNVFDSFVESVIGLLVLIVLVQPESEVINRNLMTSCIDVIQKSCFKILDVRIFTELSPVTS
jgi:hypothetical protein